MFILQERPHGETYHDGKPINWYVAFGPTDNIPELLRRKLLADGYSGYAQHRIVDDFGQEFEFFEKGHEWLLQPKR